MKFLSLLSILLISLPAIADLYKVRRDNVQVYAEATSKSNIVAHLKKGDGVDAQSRKGMYWSVKTADGKTGFVSTLDVIRVPPTETAELKKAMEESASSGRKNEASSRTRTSNAVMGIRGLSAEEKLKNVGETKPNMQRVYEMEDRQVDKTKVKKLENSVSEEVEKKATEGK